jgi:hypothetical protein
MVADQHIANGIIAALMQRVMHAEILCEVTAASVTVKELRPLFEMALDRLSVAFRLDGGVIQTSSLHVMGQNPCLPKNSSCPNANATCPFPYLRTFLMKR